jgi:protein-S-isoprenylcysteine O-methyltransferase Ste14
LSRHWKSPAANFGFHRRHGQRAIRGCRVTIEIPRLDALRHFPLSLVQVTAPDSRVTRKTTDAATGGKPRMRQMLAQVFVCLCVIAIWAFYQLTSKDQRHEWGRMFLGALLLAWTLIGVWQLIDLATQR